MSERAKRTAADRWTTQVGSAFATAATVEAAFPAVARTLSEALAARAVIVRLVTASRPRAWTFDGAQPAAHLVTADLVAGGRFFGSLSIALSTELDARQRTLVDRIAGQVAQCIAASGA